MSPSVTGNAAYPLPVISLENLPVERGSFVTASPATRAQDESAPSQPPLTEPSREREDESMGEAFDDPGIDEIAGGVADYLDGSRESPGGQGLTGTRE